MSADAQQVVQGVRSDGASVPVFEFGARRCAWHFARRVARGPMRMSTRINPFGPRFHAVSRMDLGIANNAWRALVDWHDARQRERHRSRCIGVATIEYRVYSGHDVDDGCHPPDREPVIPNILTMNQCSKFGRILSQSEARRSSFTGSRRVDLVWRWCMRASMWYHHQFWVVELSV